MNQPERKTFAEFLHPSDEQIGTVEYSLREVDSRDPLVPPGPPTDAIGVRFFDVVSIEVEDSGKDIICKSDRIDPDPGITFYSHKVKVLTPAEVQAGSDIPAFMKTLVLANMANNGWSIVVFAAGVVLPFNAGKDRVL